MSDASNIWDTVFLFNKSTSALSIEYIVGAKIPKPFNFQTYVETFKSKFIDSFFHYDREMPSVLKAEVPVFEQGMEYEIGLCRIKKFESFEMLIAPLRKDGWFPGGVLGLLFFWDTIQLNIKDEELSQLPNGRFVTPVVGVTTNAQLSIDSLSSTGQPNLLACIQKDSKNISGKQSNENYNLWFFIGKQDSKEIDYTTSFLVLFRVKR